MPRDEPAVERCELAPDLSIARVLTGLWQIADMERGGKTLDPLATARCMQPYVAAGFTTFDMADHYGSAEVIAGTYRAELAGDSPAGDPGVQLLTKWVPEPGPVTHEQVRAAVRRALERLRTERIDLLQFHAWNYHDLSYVDCLRHLNELKQEGLIGHLGLTNFDTAHLRVLVASGFEIVSNQVSHSLIDRRAAGAMAAYCREHGVKLLAYGTLAGGFLTERWLGADEPSLEGLATWSQRKYKRFIDAAGGWQPFQHLLRTLDDVARRHDASIANVATRAILDQPAVGGIILGARLGESEHIESNRRLASLRLEDADRAAIDAACAGLDPIPGDCGDEYRRPPFLTASGDLAHHLSGFPPAMTAVEDGGRARVSSGTTWEDLAGYSRAVRDGRRILVSGTTATHGPDVIGGDDPAAQAHFVIDKLGAAIESLGGRLEDVVRTRVYVNDLADWEPIARAHGERFAGIRPANTLVEARLIGGGYKVEIEADALVPEERS